MVKTIYAACLARLGLSQSEAARLHNVRLDTVKSWSSGRNRVPLGAWDELRDYEGVIDDAAGDMLERWELAKCPPIELDASEAQGHILMSAAAFVLATTGPLRIGKTDATIMARQARRPN